MDQNNIVLKIDEIAKNNNYDSDEKWLDRGLNPSSQEVTDILNKATVEFLNKLKEVVLSQNNEKEILWKINALVDDLPWDDLDTEEKEFLADVLAPAIQAFGFNPWNIF